MRERLRAVRERGRTGIERAFAEEHTPHEIAGSFAFGVFFVALPTAGTAFAVFLAVAYFFDRASKLALAASLVVFNPVVKWAVYGASFWLGSRLLGPVDGVSPTTFSLDAGYDIVLRQLLGNAILAVALALLGYVVVLVVAREYHQRTFSPGDFST